MIAPPPNQPIPPLGDDLMPPQRSPQAEFWRLLRKNRMAFSGLVVFGLFFLVALLGLGVVGPLPRGADPLVVVGVAVVSDDREGGGGEAAGVHG